MPDGPGRTAVRSRRGRHEGADRRENERRRLRCCPSRTRLEVTVGVSVSTLEEVAEGAAALGGLRRRFPPRRRGDRRAVRPAARRSPTSWAQIEPHRPRIAADAAFPAAVASALLGAVRASTALDARAQPVDDELGAGILVASGSSHRPPPPTAVASERSSARASTYGVCRASPRRTCWENSSRSSPRRATGHDLDRRHHRGARHDLHRSRDPGPGDSCPPGASTRPTRWPRPPPRSARSARRRARTALELPHERQLTAGAPVDSDDWLGWRAIPEMAIEERSGSRSRRSSAGGGASPPW